MAKCKFPHKRKYTKAEAKKALAAAKRQFRGVNLYSYRCPAGEHWHLGRRGPTKRKAW